MPRVTPPDRHDRILDAARAAFAERGFAGTRMDDIATRAGISRSAVYSRFESKEALFRALVTALVEDTIPALSPDLEGVPAPAALHAFIKAVLLRLTRGDLAFLPRLIVGEGPAFPDLVRYYHDHAISRVLGRIEALIDHGIARGEFVPCDPALAARSVAGGVIFSALWKIVFEPAGMPTLDVAAMADHHAGMMLDGLCMRVDVNR